MTAVAPGRSVGRRDQRPEPARFWIRHAPTRWSGAAECWVDLATATLGRSEPEVDVEDWPPPGFDDTVYVPPGGAAGDAEAHWLVQVVAGEAAPSKGWTVVDVLAAILDGRLDALDETPSSASVAWPLGAGIGDSPQLWAECLPRLARAGVEHVQPVTLSLGPRDRRWLGERLDGEAWDRLFHAAPAAERTFSRAAARFGLRPFLARPVGASEGRQVGRRVAAGCLALAAELWLRCGRPEADGHALYRAARWVDEADVDVLSVAREGNLSVVPALDARGRDLLETVAAGGRPEVLDELERAYLEDEE